MYVASLVCRHRAAHEPRDIWVGCMVGREGPILVLASPPVQDSVLLWIPACPMMFPRQWCVLVAWFRSHFVKEPTLVFPQYRHRCDLEGSISCLPKITDSVISIDYRTLSVICSVASWYIHERSSKYHKLFHLINGRVNTNELEAKVYGIEDSWCYWKAKRWSFHLI